MGLFERGLSGVGDIGGERCLDTGKVDGGVGAWVVVGLNSCSSSSVNANDSGFSSINS